MKDARSAAVLHSFAAGARTELAQSYLFFPPPPASVGLRSWSGPSMLGSFCKSVCDSPAHDDEDTPFYSIAFHLEPVESWFASRYDCTMTRTKKAKEWRGRCLRREGREGWWEPTLGSRGAGGDQTSRCARSRRSEEEGRARQDCQEEEGSSRGNGCLARVSCVQQEVPHPESYAAEVCILTKECMGSLLMIATSFCARV